MRILRPALAVIALAVLLGAPGLAPADNVALADDSPPEELSLSDFDGGGDDVALSALIEAGGEGRKSDPDLERAWYAADTAAWHASGSMVEGSLDLEGTTLARVLYLAETGVLRFNHRSDGPNMGEYFGSGGPGAGMAVHVQRAADDAVSFPVEVASSGGKYVNLEVPAEHRAALAGIGEGDRFILALTRPVVASDPAPPAPELPAPVLELAPPVIEDGDVVLSWTVVSDKNGVSGYTLERTPALPDGIVSVWVLYGSYRDTSVEPGQTYTYELTATGPGGSNSYTVRVHVPEADPEPPVLELAAPEVTEDGEVELSWTVISGKNQVSGYTLERTPALPDGTVSLLALFGGYRDTSVERGQTYTYELTATGPGGSNSYTVSVTVPEPGEVLSTDATLGSLSLSGVTLAPAFAPGTMSYTATVTHDVDQTNVTAAAADPAATFTVQLDGTAVTDGVLALSDGDNTLTVTVTAEDTSLQSVYTVVITREPAPPVLAPGVTEEPEVALSLSDFASGGDDVLVSALIEAGREGRKDNGSQDRAWYATETEYWHASGRLVAGTLELGGSPVARVMYIASSGVLRFNDASPEPVMRDFFGTDGQGAGKTVHVQTGIDTVASFPVNLHTSADGAGWNYVNLDVPSEHRAALAGVGEGDRFILAVTRPGTAPPLSFEDFTLETLTVSDVNLDAFDPVVADYARNVAGDVQTVTVAATPAEASSTVAITPEDADTDEDGHQVTLVSGGDTVITVTVTASGGETSTTYTVTLTQLTGTTGPLSSDPSLSSLTLSGIDFGPFDSDVTHYEYMLDNVGGMTTVTATPTHSGATVAITPGDATADLGHQVDLGRSTAIRVKVTSQDGGATKSYTVALINFLPPGCLLEDLPGSLRVDAYWGGDCRIVDRSHYYSGSLVYTSESGYHSRTRFYRLTVAERGEVRIQLTGIRRSSFIMLRSSGGDRIAVNSREIVRTLDAGTYIIEAVLSQGQVGYNFTLTVTGDTVASRGDARLSSLTLSGVEMPGFRVGPDTRYARNVAADVTSTTVTAVAAQAEHGATLTISPADADGITAGHQIALTDGENVISITVTAPNVTDMETVTVTLNQLAGTTSPLRTGSSLSSLELSGIDFGPFDSAVTRYEHTVVNIGGMTTVTATTTDPEGTVTIRPADASDVEAGHQVKLHGETTVTVTGTAQDGTTTTNYTVSLDVLIPSGCVLEDLPGSLRVERTWDRPCRPKARSLYPDGSQYNLNTGNDFPHTRSRFYRLSLHEAGDVRVHLTEDWWRWCCFFLVVRSADGAVIASAAKGSSSDLSIQKQIPEPEVTVNLDAGVYIIEAVKRYYFEGKDFILTVTGDTVVPFGDATLESLTLSGVDMPGFHLGRDTRYARNVAADVTSTTVAAVASQGEHGATVAITPADADPATDGHQVALNEGENVITVTVTAPNGTDTRTVTITLTQLPGTVSPLSDDPSLSALSLSGIDIGTFDPAQTEYRYTFETMADFLEGVSITVSPTPTQPLATWRIIPGDEDALAEGHQFVTHGGRAFEIIVTAPDGVTQRRYVVRPQPYPYPRDADRDIALDAANGDPGGIWSDGETIWVADQEAGMVFAYDLESGQYLRSVDVEGDVSGLASDGTTIWVGDSHQNRSCGASGIRAYDLATWTRRPGSDISTGTPRACLGYTNIWPLNSRDLHLKGMWSDGRYVWANVNLSGHLVVAFAPPNGAHSGESGPLFGSLPPWSPGGETLDARGYAAEGSWGPWSDGQTLWTASTQGKIFAYDLHTFARRPGLDVEVLNAAGNRNLRGIWSDGETLWVVDDYDGKLYAYIMPPSARLKSLDLSGVDLGAFLPGRYDYRADVANSTSVTTVAATQAFSGGSSAVTISAGGVSDDADPATDGHQVNLAVGANVITITVTAPNGSDTRIYTVTVNRASG